MWPILDRVHSKLRPQALLSALLALTPTLTPLAQDVKTGPKTVEVKRGQTISLSLLTPIDSGHANLGDDVTLQLDRPLVADGATVLPADWIVHGKVTKVKRAGKNCKDGQVVWELDRIKTPRDDQLKLQRVHSYPFNSASAGDPLWVPLDTPLTKIGGMAKFTGLLAASVALSPLLIPLGVAATERCEGRAGQEQSLPLGLGDLFAVAKSEHVKSTP